MNALFLAIAMAPSTPKDYPVQPVPFNQVHLTDKFWAPKIEINRTVTIPYAFEMCEKTGRMDLFRRAATALRKEPLADRTPPGYPFDDSDLYKVLEGAAYALSVTPDPKLDAYVDSIIKLIADAQEPDGYLYCTRTINPEAPHPWAGKERWVLEEENSHELYNLGHLYEAAAAHFQATGKRTLLNVALKSADLLVETFLKPKRKIWPGHQVIEIGLGKLYRITGKQEYLELSKFFLDSRGGSGEYWQAHKPVTEQTEAVGHAVRATYMYSGMADVAAMQGDPKFAKAINAIWTDVVGSKYYITGGIGSTGAGEAFGKAYDLPNLTAYCETCAQIGNVFWNQRLFLMHGQAQFMDVLERTLYNGMLSGVALDGKTFFYPNPLESIGQNQRSAWFGCACCPSNVTRFMASIPGYFYAHNEDTLFVNLFASNHAEVTLGKRKIKVEQETNFPWEGNVKIKVDCPQPSRFKVFVRIPGWARGEVVPSKLYSSVDQTSKPKLSVNGKKVPVVIKDGYAVLDREWRTGDTIAVDFPMPIKRIVSNESVLMNRGRVAIQRGPIVYCAEGVDNEKSVRSMMLPDKAAIQAVKRPDLLGGVVTLKSTAMDLATQPNGDVKQTPKPLTLIPYYAWANRGRSEMLVWIPSRLDAARPTPLPTVSTKAKITTSGGASPNAINDGFAPAYMGDSSNVFFHWWPKKGTQEWVEMTFAEEATVSEAMLYWFDDTGVGECRVPEGWRLLYKAGNEWKPVTGVSKYGVLKDQPNPIKFDPVRTTALRLEVKLQNNWSSGVWEWSVK